jgi:DNA polymerase-3 subunit beta
VESHLIFTVGGRTLASKTVEAQFPAFEKVIAVTGDKTVVLGREVLATAIRRVSLLSSERSRAVKLSLETGKLDLQASSPDLGEARESVPAEYKGPAVEIGFNAQYILDFLGAAGSDQVLLEVKDHESQGTLKPKADGETDYRYVVMPMRL